MAALSGMQSTQVSGTPIPQYIYGAPRPYGAFYGRREVATSPPGTMMNPTVDHTTTMTSTDPVMFHPASAPMTDSHTSKSMNTMAATMMSESTNGTAKIARRQISSAASGGTMQMANNPDGGMMPHPMGPPGALGSHMMSATAGFPATMNHTMASTTTLPPGSTVKMAPTIASTTQQLTEGVAKPNIRRELSSSPWSNMMNQTSSGSSSHPMTSTYTPSTSGAAPAISANMMPSSSNSNLAAAASHLMATQGTQANLGQMYGTTPPGSMQMPSGGPSQMASIGSNQMPSAGLMQMPSTGSMQTPSTGSMQMPSTGSMQMPSTGSMQMVSMNPSSTGPARTVARREFYSTASGSTPSANAMPSTASTTASVMMPSQGYPAAMSQNYGPPSQINPPNISQNSVNPPNMSQNFGNPPNTSQNSGNPPNMSQNSGYPSQGYPATMSQPSGPPYTTYPSAQTGSGTGSTSMTGSSPFGSMKATSGAYPMMSSGSSPYSSPLNSSAPMGQMTSQSPYGSATMNPNSAGTPVVSIQYLGSNPSTSAQGNPLTSSALNSQLPPSSYGSGQPSSSRSPAAAQ
ncbi:hypothetical protein PtA15_8A19 [Puccinia triticina]|uniref:Uncharacterized protein n=1 Tax=Puccinia triticina TaxID=208348 RepID=A0ABY7CS02_9BASI|nr:uncharacterized protein PtA15_8A19 [Puccinia triticina]WAQ87118.1 hypothetical protein PtA15_8A19 [Puccinia triticina]